VKEKREREEMDRDREIERLRARERSRKKVDRLRRFKSIVQQGGCDEPPPAIIDKAHGRRVDLPGERFVEGVDGLVRLELQTGGLHRAFLRTVDAVLVNSKLEEHAWSERVVAVCEKEEKARERAKSMAPVNALANRLRYHRYRICHVGEHRRDSVLPSPAANGALT